MITFRDIKMFPNRKNEDNGYGYRPELGALNIFVYRDCTAYADYAAAAVAAFNLAFKGKVA
jgi:hypothetical protein